MDKMPKRRKRKDNPYVLSKDEKNNLYLVSFVDGTNTYRSIRVSKEVYEEMDYFERRDLSEMNEYDNHIEHSEIYENTLHTRMLNPTKSLESYIENKLDIEQLKIEIEHLPRVQRERLKKYYFDNKTLKQIGMEEHCSKTAIKYSIDNAIRNISIKLKKFKI